VDFSGLRAGDRLSATIITQKPPQVLTERQVQATLASPAAGAAAGGAAGAGAAAAARPAGGGTGAAAGATAGSKAATGGGAAGSGAAAGGGTAPRLPKTASGLPLVGMIGAFSLALGAGLTAIRRRREVR
jgi:LPXTG-motif cell wall-anchored protein